MAHANQKYKNLNQNFHYIQFNAGMGQNYEKGRRFIWHGHFSVLTHASPCQVILGPCHILNSLWDPCQHIFIITFTTTHFGLITMLNNFVLRPSGKYLEALGTISDLLEV